PAATTLAAAPVAPLAAAVEALSVPTPIVVREPLPAALVAPLAAVVETPPVSAPVVVREPPRAALVAPPVAPPAAVVETPPVPAPVVVREPPQAAPASVAQQAPAVETIAARVAPIGHPPAPNASENDFVETLLDGSGLRAALAS